LVVETVLALALEQADRVTAVVAVGGHLTICQVVPAQLCKVKMVEQVTPTTALMAAGVAVQPLTLQHPVWVLLVALVVLLVLRGHLSNAVVAVAALTVVGVTEEAQETPEVPEVQES
jgi:hypothetical protein